jgi:hypothetical protein
MNNADPISRSLDLYIMLDVYGMYWFGPCWTEDLCHYDIEDLQGHRMMDILAFQWPDVTGQASGLLFWGALFENDTFNLFGNIGYVSFGYEPGLKTPTPAPTQTPSAAPTTPGMTPTPKPTTPPEPTNTPTPIPPDMSVWFNNDDPGSYPEESCETPECYCFEPQIIPFCSDYQLIARVTNTGESILHVDLSFSGESAGEFEAESNGFDIQPHQSRDIRIKFCPQMPRDEIKHANLQINGAGTIVTVRLAGYGA